MKFEVISRKKNRTTKDVIHEVTQVTETDATVTFWSNRIGSLTFNKNNIISYREIKVENK